MFLSFAGVCFTVKSKSIGKHLLLTGKTLRKIRKTVYENFFCKPFSKTRVMFLSTHFTPLLLSLLSHFLTVSALFLTVSTPAKPHWPVCSLSVLFLCSLSLSLFTFSFAQLLPSQPEPPSATSCLAYLSSPLMSLARFPFPWSLLHSTALFGLSLALADLHGAHRKSGRTHHLRSRLVLSVFSPSISPCSQRLLAVDLLLLVFFFSFCSISLFFFFFYIYSLLRYFVSYFGWFLKYFDGSSIMERC